MAFDWLSEMVFAGSKHEKKKFNYMENNTHDWCYSEWEKYAFHNLTQRLPQCRVHVRITKANISILIESTRRREHLELTIPAELDASASYDTMEKLNVVCKQVADMINF